MKAHTIRGTCIVVELDIFALQILEFVDELFYVNVHVELEVQPENRPSKTSFELQLCRRYWV